MSAFAEIVLFALLLLGALGVGVLIVGGFVGAFYCLGFAVEAGVNGDFLLALGRLALLALCALSIATGVWLMVEVEWHWPDWARSPSPSGAGSAEVAP